MNLNEQLANYEQKGLLHQFIARPDEVRQHLVKAERHLTDAQRKENSLETRFSIANTAGHALLLAALKIKGYRTSSEKGHRAVLYQLLDALVPGAANAKKTLSDAHNARNRAEYDGDDWDVTEAQVEDIIDAVKSLKEELDYMYRKFKSDNPLA